MTSPSSSPMGDGKKAKPFKEGKASAGPELTAAGSDADVQAKLARMEAEIKADIKTSSPLSPPVPVATPGSTYSGSAPLADLAAPSPKVKTKADAGVHINMALFWTLAIVSILVANVPIINFLLTPINQFVVLVHEGSHAIASLLTGGHPAMTIVSDGQGHGGITHPNGGFSFLVTQAGYLGTAFFGCILIWLGQFPKYSRAVLTGLGIMIILSTLLFIVPSLFSPVTFVAGLFSMMWGLVMGASCIYMGNKLRPILANLVVLFLAIQTALNSISLIWILIPHGLGLAGNGWSDATNMQSMTFIPAFIWALIWMALSLAMVFFTLKFTYGSAILNRKKIKKDL